MDTIGIERNSFWMKLFRATYNIKEGKESTDGCLMGWGFIFLILIAVLKWVFVLLRWVLKDKVTSSVIGEIALTTMINIGFIIVGGTIIESTNILPFFASNPFAYLIVGLVVILLVLLILFTLIYLVFSTYVFLKDSALYKKVTLFRISKQFVHPRLTKKPSFIKEWIKAKKEKSCPRIEYK